MFREDGSCILMHELNSNLIPESFIQHLNFSGLISFRDAKTNESIIIELANWDYVNMIARKFGIKPIFHY
ncbi:hypothetical protein [Dendrosporobacter sp. 1207_IL3150]|uniref:hypothetical protein n=1 Tax=Dendrosporobacter sp. 1207_IL3150 TaxID=3084054 RepID=UPI002FDA2ED0